MEDRQGFNEDPGIDVMLEAIQRIKTQPGLKLDFFVCRINVDGYCFDGIMVA